MNRVSNGNRKALERTGLRFFEKDLRVKITAILLVFIIVATGAALIISYTLVTHIVRDNIGQANADAARLSRDVVEVALESRATRTALLTSLPVMRDPATPPDVRQATLALSVETWPIAREALFVDTNGNIVCGTGKLAQLPNASGTSWFDNAQSGGITFTYISSKSELTTAFFLSPVLAVSSDVRDSKNQIFGYVVTFTNTTDISSGIETVMLAKTGHGFLVNSDGTIVAGQIFPAARRPTPADKQALDELLGQMSKGHGGQQSVSYAGTGYLVAWTPVERAGTNEETLEWTVGVVVPISEAYAPARDVALALLLLALVLLVFGVVAAFLLGRSITRPIDELVSNAEKVGSGDLTGDVVIRTRDQIGTLAAAFLRMRDYLRSALAEAVYTADKMSELAEEQSAGTGDVFENAEDIVESVVVLSKNMESQTQKIRKVMEYVDSMPDDVQKLEAVSEIKELLQASEILADVGANKAVEIAAATQDQRGAARDVAAASRRLSAMARELKETVQRFKV